MDAARRGGGGTAGSSGAGTVDGAGSAAACGGTVVDIEVRLDYVYVYDVPKCMVLINLMGLYGVLASCGILCPLLSFSLSLLLPPPQYLARCSSPGQINVS